MVDLLSKNLKICKFKNFEHKIKNVASFTYKVMFCLWKCNYFAYCKRFLRKIQIQVYVTARNIIK